MTADRPMDEDDSMIGPAPWTPPPAEPAASTGAKPSRDPAPTGRRGGGFGFAALLLVLLVGGLGGLVGAAQLAPLLPASIGRYLAPAASGVDEARVATVEAELREALASVTDTATRAARDSAETQQALAALRQRTDTLAASLDALEARPEAPLGDSGGSDTSAAVAALEAQIATLRNDLDAVSTDATDTASADVLSRLSDRVAALEQGRAEADAAGAQGPQDRLDPVRANAVATALDGIDAAMATGEPFAEALQQLEIGAGLTAPAPLRAAAADGVATRETLLEAFTPAAHAAVTEALAQDSGEGVQSVLARVQARFTGIPAEPQEGDTVPAILSRARHALLTGRLSTALEEVDTLPAEAATAMADWTDRARLRRDSDEALEALQAALEDRY